MSRAWKEVFGDQADRVVVVAEGQGVWPITSDKILKCRCAWRLERCGALAPGLRPVGIKVGRSGAA